jgi:hypothetical protein
MESKKVIKLTYFIISLQSFLTFSTPLAFEDIWTSNVVYLPMVILAFFVAREIKNRFLKNVLKWLPILVFCFFVVKSFTAFTYPVTSGWKTVWISHRDKNQPKIFIG